MNIGMSLSFYYIAAGVGLAIYVLMPARVTTDILTFKLPSINQIRDDLYIEKPPQIASGAGDVSTKPMGPVISDSTQSLIDANKMVLGGEISMPPDIAAPVKMPIRGGVRSSRY